MFRQRMTPVAMVPICALAAASSAQNTADLNRVFTDSSTELTFIIGGVSYEFTPGDVRRHPAVDALSVSGHMGDDGSFVLARGPIGIEGCVWVGDRAWIVRARHDDNAPMFIEHQQHEERCGGAIIPSGSNPGRDALPHDDGIASPLGSDDPLSTRILIVYDQLAVDEVGDMNAFAAALVESANTSYANSGVNTMRLELAGIQEVEVRPTGDSGILLRQLTNQYDSTFDIAHRVRDALDADIVAHLSELSGVCGRGWLSPGNADFAFTTTDVDCALGNLSFAHEVGHNQGCTHDPDNAGGGYVDYGFGHRWDSNRFRSVMAYSPGSRLMYFSNPDVLHNGFPTGIANERDNARVLELTQGMMANLRIGDGTGPDCDLNGLADDYEIALDGALDLDRNGQLDACQITSDPGLDCDNDGTLDQFQTMPRIEHLLGIANAFGDNVAPQFDVDLPLPESIGDVEVIVTASGDLGTSAEYLTLSFNNGAFTRNIFTGSSSDCRASGERESFTMSAMEFNALNDAGISVLVVPTADVNLGVCTYTYLDIRFVYRTQDSSIDMNGDGVIDACICPADLNGDGELNFFDVTEFISAYQSQDSVADFNGDGIFSFFDVAEFIAAFNAGCP